MCCAAGHLQQLDLTSYNMQCAFPISSLDLFPSMQTLILSSNPNVTVSGTCLSERIRYCWSCSFESWQLACQLSDPSNLEVPMPVGSHASFGLSETDCSFAQSHHFHIKKGCQTSATASGRQLYIMRGTSLCQQSRLFLSGATAPVVSLCYACDMQKVQQ